MYSNDPSLGFISLLLPEKIRNILFSAFCVEFVFYSLLLAPLQFSFFSHANDFFQKKTICPGGNYISIRMSHSSTSYLFYSLRKSVTYDFQRFSSKKLKIGGKNTVFPVFLTNKLFFQKTKKNWSWGIRLAFE